MDSRTPNTFWSLPSAINATLAILDHTGLVQRIVEVGRVVVSVGHVNSDVGGAAIWRVHVGPVGHGRVARANVYKVNFGLFAIEHHSSGDVAGVRIDLKFAAGVRLVDRIDDQVVGRTDVLVDGSHFGDVVGLGVKGFDHLIQRNGLGYAHHPLEPFFGLGQPFWRLVVPVRKRQAHDHRRAERRLALVLRNQCEHYGLWYAGRERFSQRNHAGRLVDAKVVGVASGLGASRLNSILYLGIFARVRVARNQSVYVVARLRVILDRQFVLGLVEKGRMVVYVENFYSKGTSVRERMRLAFVFGLDRDAVLVVFVVGLAVEHNIGGDQASGGVNAKRLIAFVVSRQYFVFDLTIFAFVRVNRLHLNYFGAHGHFFLYLGQP
ncbi:hypothetical protein BpHYR1_005943 [Brachionus plicatilis]|uniref:Uncharacterized protein n=1 Tax=Brachionus plicatilis TaxID=10195 RepID=A0A3M7SRR3_BRAPC|nr:hypothetical protein BpHYR1_005943 [Brachionus plicatilis]